MSYKLETLAIIITFVSLFSGNSYGQSRDAQNVARQNELLQRSLNAFADSTRERISAVELELTKVQKCANAEMAYGPKHAKADANGCITIGLKSCSVRVQVSGSEAAPIFEDREFKHGAIIKLDYQSYRPATTRTCRDTSGYTERCSGQNRPSHPGSLSIHMCLDGNIIIVDDKEPPYCDPNKGSCRSCVETETSNTGIFKSSKCIKWEK